MILVLMGVSGCGKTTVGTQLSRMLGWSFADADDYHPARNKNKMAAGIALTDEDRHPWLASLARMLAEREQAGKSTVLACSALKDAYRQILSERNPGIRFVYLKADFSQIAERLESRKHEYMSNSLLASQFDTLEEPGDAIVIDASAPVDDIVKEVYELVTGRTTS